VTVNVGEEAPDFTLKDQHGQHVTLSALRGNKAVVLVFYPFAFSSVCTSELCALRDDLPTFHNDDVALLAVSCDPMYALRVFADRDRLTYPLLSDFWPHGAVTRAYGVFDEGRGCPLRGTFVIDTAGMVRWKVENGLPDVRDVAAYRAALANLAA
jgi:peroxiredoxin